MANGPKFPRVMFAGLDDARLDERGRVRKRKMRGNAGAYEKHWLWIQDEMNGRYVPPECGPYFEEFGADVRWPIPGKPTGNKFRSPREMLDSDRPRETEPVDKDVLY